MAEPKSIYDYARERAQQQVGANTQKNQDALARRFAALGMQSSGAAIKQQSLAQEQGNQDLENAQAGINAAEAQDRAQKEEAQKQRDFASGEALKQREFQGAQANIDRAFQEKVFAFDSASKLRQLDLMERQFTMAKDESEFNKRLAAYQARHSGGLLGGGGFLGLGMGDSATDLPFQVFKGGDKFGG